MKFEILENGKLVDTKELGEGSHKVGRAADCAIALKSPQVSKQHALLVIKGDKAAIVDLGSSNGVFVNGILVRKQRIELGDEVNIGSYTIRAPKVSKVERNRVSASPPPLEGNAAPDLDYAVASEPAAQEAPEAMSPQDKLLLLMDQKVLAPFYALMKSFDWRLLLACILLVAMVLSVMLSVIPIFRWGKGITSKEALARAHTILGQTVRENYRILTKTSDTARLTVEAAESEQGILSCVIVDPKNNGILAPAKLFNKSVTDVYAIIALKKIVDGKEEVVSVEKEDDVYIVAQPIFAFSPETNDRALSAIVMAEFQVPAAMYSTFEPLVEAALFSILLSLAAYYLIFKMFSYPVIHMHEQLDSALKGEEVTVTSEAKFSELETLATVINFSISRWKQGGGVGAINQSGDSKDEDQSYVNCVTELDQGSSDALLLLDRDKKVRYVGKILEDLIGMRNQYAQNQNISDACRDQSFAGTAIDLCDKVVSSLGETQAAILDLNGVARNLVAVAHRNSAQEIRFVLITVKMNG